MYAQREDSTYRQLVRFCILLARAFRKATEFAGDMEVQVWRHLLDEAVNWRLSRLTKFIIEFGEKTPPELSSFALIPMDAVLWYKVRPIGGIHDSDVVAHVVLMKWALLILQRHLRCVSLETPMPLARCWSSALNKMKLSIPKVCSVCDDSLLSSPRIHKKIG